MAKLSGNWINKVLRLAIYMRDRFTCVYCLRDLHDAPSFDMTLDHVTPREFGGRHIVSNLVTACRSCNSSKQHKLDWMNKRQEKRVARQVAKPLNIAAAEKIYFGE